MNLRLINWSTAEIRNCAWIWLMQFAQEFSSKLITAEFSSLEAICVYMCVCAVATLLCVCMSWIIVCVLVSHPHLVNLCVPYVRLTVCSRWKMSATQVNTVCERTHMIDTHTQRTLNVPSCGCVSVSCLNTIVLFWTYCSESLMSLWILCSASSSQTSSVCVCSRACVCRCV